VTTHLSQEDGSFLCVRPRYFSVHVSNTSYCSCSFRTCWRMWPIRTGVALFVNAFPTEGDQ
jgi:hypothetical protein